MNSLKSLSPFKIILVFFFNGGPKAAIINFIVAPPIGIRVQSGIVHDDVPCDNDKIRCDDICNINESVKQFQFFGISVLLGPDPISGNMCI